MMIKKFRVLTLCMALTMISPVAVMAETDNSQTEISAEAELAQLLELDETQYTLATKGSVELIVPGDYLLDGNYENGELVNGSIYYSVEEALAGVKQDKTEAQRICTGKERVTPTTGTITGPNSNGNFSYTIAKSGRTNSFSPRNSSTWVSTQSRIYRDISGGSYLDSTDFSYLVTLMDAKGNSKGTFRAHPDNISGGVNFDTQANSSYYLKLQTEDFPFNWYLNGSGSIAIK